MTTARHRLVVSPGDTGLGFRYAVVEDDGRGPILRAGPFWSRTVAMCALARVKVERKYETRRILRRKRRAATMN